MINIDDVQYPGDYFDDRYVQPPAPIQPPGWFGDQYHDASAMTPDPWDPYAGDFNNIPPPGPPTYSTPPPTVYNPPPSYNYQPPVRGPLPSLNYPQFNAPTFNAPAPLAPATPFSYGDFSHDPFAYESFQGPTLAEAQNEPGFEFALQQGVKALENSKAYQGTYKSGATIKGLNDYARNMANQNYNQVYERQGQTYDRNRANAFGVYDTNRGTAFDTYKTNRDNAFGSWDANRQDTVNTYATNYGVTRDVYDRNYTAAKDAYAPQARAAELNFGREWDQYAYEGDDAYRRWKAMIDANS